MFRARDDDNAGLLLAEEGARYEEALRGVGGF